MRFAENKNLLALFPGLFVVTNVHGKVDVMHFKAARSRYLPY